MHHLERSYEDYYNNRQWESNLIFFNQILLTNSFIMEMFGHQYGEFVCVYRAGGLNGEVLSHSSHTPIQGHVHSLTLLLNDLVLDFSGSWLTF